VPEKGDEDVGVTAERTCRGIIREFPREGKHLQPTSVGVTLACGMARGSKGPRPFAVSTPTFGRYEVPLEAGTRARFGGYPSVTVSLGWWIRAVRAMESDTSSDTSLTWMRSPAALAPSSSMM
jgi:hypothetical protein